MNFNATALAQKESDINFGRWSKKQFVINVNISSLLKHIINILAFFYEFRHLKKMIKRLRIKETIHFEIKYISTCFHQRGW